MSKKSDELIDEAIANLSDDRKVMKEFIDGLAESSAEAEDGLMRMSFGEAFAKMSGELTKNNSLLIELAKLKAKKEMINDRSSDPFGGAEVDSMFDQIEGSGAGDDDDSN